jgi:hypothetical protein
MWREEGTDQNKHLVVVTYFTVFRLPEWYRYCRDEISPPEFTQRYEHQQVASLHTVSKP